MLQQVALGLIWAAAPPATLTVILYATTARFWRTSAGRALLVSQLGLALLIDLSLLFRVWNDRLTVKEWIALGVYSLICVGAWLMFGELLRAQVLRRRRKP